jgi:cystathionine beta-lyase/cystathionine gamma-synthase
VFPSFRDTVDTFEGNREAFIYSRYGHPTGRAVESRIAALQGTEGAVLCASGMAALTLVVLSTCRTGDHLLASPDHYGGVSELLAGIAGELGVEVEYVPLDSLDALGPRVRKTTRLVLIESPTNPLLRIVDMRAVIAGLGRERPPVAVDATIASPLDRSAVAAGCDYIVHSATKYLNGHDDVTAGVVLGSEVRLAPVRERRRVMGSLCEPQTAWLLERGMKTLGVRWGRQCGTALALAERLTTHPAVARVHYPGLESHPQHTLAGEQGSRFGALLAFETAGGLDAAIRVYDRLELIARAPTFGGVESGILHPATSSHRGLTPEGREALGITDGLLRLSVGLEDVDDIWEDLSAALG